MPAPQLALSETNRKKAELLAAMDLRTQIMNYLAEGNGWLAAAQHFKMSEKQITDVMNEVWSIRTNMIKTSAEHLQTFILHEHEDMYFRAKKMAFPEPYEREVTTKKGEEVTTEMELVTPPPDLYWFREMRISLDKMHAIISRYLDTTPETHNNFIFTFLPGSQMEQFAQGLISYADKTIYDRS